jgi:cobalt-precorrin-5B (C1)-methyltransferase
MITHAIRQITDRPLRVEVSIPGGETAALNTFNPRLGIVGGLSVLGTTGIVRPYCMRAVQDSIRCALDVAAACGVTAPVLVPGNIGAAAAREHFSPGEEQVVEVGNQWGFAVDQLATRGFSAVMLLGHPGKLAKLAAGQWDTHSARSESATGIVARIAAEILPQLPEHSETVEGIFNSLSAGQQDCLGGEVARRVSAAVQQRIRSDLPISTFLVNMAGERLGTNGDLTPWQ